MTELYELLAQIQSWHWLCLAIALLCIDAIATGGFLLGAAIAALALWITKLTIVDISWQWQLALFSILTLIFSVLYNKLFKKFNETSDAKNINNRAAQMVGKSITLTKDLPIGQSKLQIGDTFWKIHTSEAFSAGDRVSVSDYKGMDLVISSSPKT